MTCEVRTDRTGGGTKKGKNKKNGREVNPLRRQRQGSGSKTEKAAERGQARESDVTCEVSQDGTERSFEWAQIVRIS